MSVFLIFILQLGFCTRVLLRPNRDPSSRVAWIAIIMALPVIGMIAYLLLGETSIGKERLKALKDAVARLPSPQAVSKGAEMKVSKTHQPLFAAGESVDHFPPVGGNTATIAADSNAAIDDMVADIDKAKEHVHLAFYIWCADGNGTKMAQALIRATQRGVTCRALVDDLGSQALIKSDLWTQMKAGGVHLGRALEIGNPLKRVFDGRVDLRNHRKILVVDHAITYCGSQNCADPQFWQKEKFGPWVDMVLRFEGPVARQNQLVFASNWMMLFPQDDLSEILEHAVAPIDGGFPAQVIATGPAQRGSAMPEIFTTMIHAARRELFVTTPYYVPVDSIQSALCAAGNRGVKTTIIFPARNDDFAVGATSRSYYADLLAAGVEIYEYQAGLLHTKSLTFDDEMALIGSANMDKRSFDLNFENNILLCDPEAKRMIHDRQKSYLEQCRRVTMEEVAAWSASRRLWHNAMAIVGPVL